MKIRLHAPSWSLKEWKLWQRIKPLKEKVYELEKENQELKNENSKLNCYIRGL